MSVEHSESFGGSRRSYRFDVKSTKSGSPYLVITEDSHRDGKHSRGQVMLFPEQAAEFDQALRNALAYLGQAEVSAAKVADSATLITSPDFAESADFESDEPAGERDPLARAGEKWDVEEEDFVLDETARGTAIKEVAALLMRKPGAIRSRLKKLGIMDAEDRQAAARVLLDERQG